MGKQGAHARSESRGRIKALGLAIVIALCAVFVTGLVTQGDKPFRSAEPGKVSISTSTAAATSPNASDKARAGYNGTDYQKVKDTVRHATPNETLRIDAASILAIDDAHEIRAFSL